MSRYLLFILVFCIAFVQKNFAQHKDLLRMEEGKMIIHISTKISQKELDSLMKRTNMMMLSIDSLRNKNLSKVYVADGWEIGKMGKDFVELYKAMEKAKQKYGYIQEISDFAGEEAVRLSTYYPEATFGYNAFKNKRTVVSLGNGYTRFLVYQYLNANNVYLSGSFNQWATEELRMIKTDTAWYYDIKLNAGKHLYKFIVDGEWKSDVENKIKESDTYKGFNSVYFECNHVFKLAGYDNAKKVIIAGSFNDWNERDLNMIKGKTQWYLPVYLKDGSYAYKFIVDRNWILDPANKDQRDDGSGNINSFISFGKSTEFELKGFIEAKEVLLAGEFNGWSSFNIKLNKKNEQTWACNYVLAPGNYQHKYIIDGTWYPAKENLWKSVEPNYTFHLNGFTNAKDVRVSGSFISWNEPGIALNKTENGWEVKVFLNPGKQLYKFIVDGQWMIDPDNPLHEENEHRTGNSFVWMR